jgi:hypothetical protein
MKFSMFEIKYQPKVDQCSLGAHTVPEREDGHSNSTSKIYLELMSRIVGKERTAHIGGVASYVEQLENI